MNPTGADQHDGRAGPFPLEGVRVLDLSQAVSGPYVGRILSDLGADVVKVEWENPDITNVFGERIAGISGLYTQMNAGKRAVAIDHRNEAGADLVARLASRAEVVLENFRPGVLERAGLGFEVLSEQNPSLVMLSISGFGRSGPESGRAAFAPVIHAESGLLLRQAEFDGRKPTDLGIALADTIAALHGVIAVMAAMRVVAQTGRGQHIDLGMLQAMVASDDFTHAAIDGVERLYPSRGEPFEVVGGPIMIAADAKTLWMRFVDHTGETDPAPAGAELPQKVAARRACIAGWLASFTDRGALLSQLDEAGLPWADLRSHRDVLDSPTLRDGAVAQVDDHTGGTRGVIRMPYRFSGAASEPGGAAPQRGQHNHEVLAEWLGLSGEDVESLRCAGAFVDPEHAPAEGAS
ncbi:MAG: CaiB/BaiF CoA transferase family protein [Microthrixaceae bacterium]